MGIKRKISLGFVIIGIILLFSSVIALYEFVRMRKSVESLITDNIASINSSSLLLDVTDEYNFQLLRGMGLDSMPKLPDLQNDTRFISYLGSVKGSFVSSDERNIADSVMLAYTAYVHMLKNAPFVWHGDYKDRRDWYFNSLYPLYMVLRGYIQKLIYVTQHELSESSRQLTDSFYRSIMPGVVAVSIGMILIFLFNYFINFYFILPLVKISKGIQDFLTYNKSYNVPDINDDDLQLVNQNVKTLIDSNKDLMAANKNSGLR